MTRLTPVGAALAVVLLFATACGRNDGGMPDASTTTKAVCSQECSDKEVTATGCDANAVDAISATAIEVAVEVHGKLGLRKANPSACNDIYWARFEPDADSTGAFKVTVSVDDRVAEPQASEPGNPALAAWTVGVYAKPGATLQACVSAGGSSVCLPAVKSA
jgi:hypothetical protein